MQDRPLALRTYEDFRSTWKHIENVELSETYDQIEAIEWQENPDGIGGHDRERSDMTLSEQRQLIKLHEKRKCLEDDMRRIAFYAEEMFLGEELEQFIREIISSNETFNHKSGWRLAKGLLRFGEELDE